MVKGWKSWAMNVRRRYSLLKSAAARRFAKRMRPAAIFVARDAFCRMALA
jgi:hypothetical protein